MSVASAEERFWPKVDQQEGGCWLWLGNTTTTGYGRFWFEGRNWPAHRWSYSHFIAPVPDALEVDHLCRTRACVNPSHLEPVTHLENSRRAKYAAEHCTQGHVLPTPAADGRRVCRPCANERNRAYKAKNRQPRKPRPPLPHGRSKYVHDKCRCDVCRDAQREYSRRRRAAVAG